ncbi:hypothetical protein VNO78_11488 [Psophocarpus tetragonolobus]|uniref:Uncharacterized protein n=1 Tax=Psophocarpus tetragonolobus TaxID=3891 RepID=A0AAN9XNN4_PSOTE
MSSSGAPHRSKHGLVLWKTWRVSVLAISCTSHWESFVEYHTWLMHGQTSTRVYCDGGSADLKLANMSEFCASILQFLAWLGLLQDAGAGAVHPA